MTRTPTFTFDRSIVRETDWVAVAGEYMAFAAWGTMLHALLWFVGLDTVVYKQVVWRPSFVGVGGNIEELLAVSVVVGLTVAVPAILLHHINPDVTVRGHSLQPAVYPVAGGLAIGLLILIFAVATNPSEPDLAGAVGPLLTAPSLGAFVDVAVETAGWWVLITAFLLTQGGPASLMGWLVHRRLEGGFQLSDRRPQLVTVAVAILLVTAMAAVATGAAAGGEDVPDDGDIDDPAAADEDVLGTPGDDDGVAGVRDYENVSTGEYRASLPAFECRRSPGPPDGGWQYPSTRVETQTNDSDRIQIAPLFWDRPDRSGRVPGWYAIRFANDTGTMPDHTVYAIQEYAFNDSEDSPFVYDTEMYFHLAEDDLGPFYVVYEVTDLNGDAHRYVDTFCPPTPEEAS